MSDGYQVDTAALNQVIKGYQSAVDTLSGLSIGGGLFGGGQYAANAGSTQGLAALLVSGDDLGDDELEETFRQYLDRWSFGLRSLMRSGEGIAQQLKGVRDGYESLEEQVSGTFKEVMVTLMDPDPQAAEAARDKSWEQLREESGTASWTEGWDELGGDVGDSLGRMGSDVAATPGRIAGLFGGE